MGAIAGAGGMLVAFPFLFPPPQVDEKVSQEVARAAAGETILRDDSAGQDPAHWGRGAIKFYRDGDMIAAEFQDDFEVGPGPNFWIYLNSQANINDEDDFFADESREKYHKVKSFQGSQVYRFPADEFAEAESLTIWCESFGQFIASANLP